jgi:hypothetical protein
MLNSLNNFAALALAGGEGLAALFSTEQLQVQIMFYLDLYETGYLVAQVFFGLWLVPLGYLVYRSGFFPRFLGILVMLAGTVQLVDSLVNFINPGYEGVLLSILGVFAFAELLFCFWLLVVGVKTESYHANLQDSARPETSLST